MQPDDRAEKTLVTAERTYGIVCLICHVNSHLSGLEQLLRRHRTPLSAAAILGGTLLIASLTAAAQAPAMARPSVTPAGPAWLAGPGGHALETAGRDIAALSARPSAAAAREAWLAAGSALQAPMPPSKAASYRAGLRKWQQAASLMAGKRYAAAGAALEAGTRDVTAVTAGIKAATGTASITAASGAPVTTTAPSAVARAAARPASTTRAASSLRTASPVYYQYGTGMSGFAIAPDNLTTIYLMFVEIDPSTTVTVRSVSSSRVTWTRAVRVFSGGKDFEMWTGRPTSLGDSAVSFAFTGSVSRSNVETGRQQFQSSLSTPHWTVTGGWDSYPSGSTIVYPALRVAAGGGYWGYGKTTNVGSAGSTPGFSYDVTPQANVVAYSTSATGLVSPTAPTLAGSGTSVGVAVSAS